ncbi:DNA replication protein DnaC [Clostridium algifaecis]|uniref:DNA replication protein DnaC n=1 Tax=Clostridium algifaecis TaxID=1472040 RepID=A0ABS4KV15_9CLOT|nr:ATP-binding protein [Clostridium algifaecis]MBP2032694.1 DNA replication protein DnaC [Clostridium algifaecis]
MISDETKRKLRELNLDEMVDILKIQGDDQPLYTTMTFDERITLAIDSLYQCKNNKRSNRLMKQARFRFADADVNSIYYANRGLDKNQIIELSTCQYMRNNYSVVLNGFTGSGKTFLACALGKAACRQLYRVRYIRVPELLELRAEAALQGKGISKLVSKFSNYHLLILDEWLLQELSDEDVRFIFELTEKRYDCHSTIFCTQYKVSDWHTRLGGGTVADAILDRIVHKSIRIDTGSMNMREHFSEKTLL